MSNNRRSHLGFQYNPITANHSGGIIGDISKNVKVQVDGNLVSISAETKQKKEKKEGGRVVCSECCQGSSYRSFTLDCNVNEAKAQAKFENGMLELILPKKNGAAAKQLKIK